MSSQKVLLDNEEATKAFARQFATKLKAGDVVELAGDLGSGKTFFVRALAEVLGTKGVSSPSFVLKNEYTGGEFPILHYDFYRLEDPGIIKEELNDSLARQDSLMIVEWANSISGVLPEDRYKIKFKVTGENSREITISK